MFVAARESSLITTTPIFEIMYLIDNMRYFNNKFQTLKI